MAAIADSLRRPAAPDPPAPLGPRRRHLGRAAPDGRAAAHALPLAARAARRADRRLLLPPLRAGRAARRAQPVRRRTGGLPHRPGRRRLRLPVRHRPPVPGRQRARARGLPRRLARVGAVHLAARAPERRRVRVVRLLRRLPGRLHGGQVLHRAAPRRARSRVRARARRGRAGRARTVGRGRSSATQGRRGTARRSRCRRPCASARRPAPERRGARRRHLAPGGGDRGGRSVLAVPLGSLEQHGPHLPLDTDTRIAVAVAPGLAARRADVAVAPAVAYGASGEHAGFPGHAARRPRGPGRAARRAGPLRPRLLRRRRAGQRARRQRGRAGRGAAPLRRRGRRRAGLACRHGGRRRARRPDRDVADAGHRPRGPCASSWPSPAAPSRSTRCCPVCAPKGCGRYRPTACWAIPRVRAPRRAGAPRRPGRAT